MAVHPNSPKKADSKKRAPRPQYSPEYAVFVRHLRAAIEQSPYSQTELADKIGKPQSYISKILAGYQAITAVEAWKLLDAADVPFPAWARELDVLLRQEAQSRKSQQ